MANVLLNNDPTVCTSSRDASPGCLAYYINHCADNPRGHSVQGIKGYCTPARPEPRDHSFCVAHARARALSAKSCASHLGPLLGAYGKFTRTKHASKHARIQTTISRIAAIVQFIARGMGTHKRRAPLDRARRRQCDHTLLFGGGGRCGGGGENTMDKRTQRPSTRIRTRRVITPEFVSDTFGLEVACASASAPRT